MVRSQPSLTPRFSAAIEGWSNPGLQALYGFIMTFFDFSPDRFQIGLFGVRETRKTEGSGSSGGSDYKVSSIHARESTAVRWEKSNGGLEVEGSWNLLYSRLLARTVSLDIAHIHPKITARTK